MDFYDGLMFFIALCIGAIPIIILRLKEKKIDLYLMFFSLLMIFAVYSKDVKGLIYLFLYIFLEWHVIAIFQLSLRKIGKNKAIFHHAIIFALLPLIIAKCSGLFWKSWFSFIGISYITFKVLQIIFESYDGVIEKSDFFSTVNFLIFFPALSSGPIDRSRRFENDLKEELKKEEYIELLQIGIQKILLGVLYKFVLSAIAFDLLEKITGRYDPLYLIAYAYVYGIYMFFDFAGYSAMAVGTGYIFGIRVPDNFNKPFLSIDIKEFWDRWHISLSHWFKDFVFSRFMLYAIREKKFKNRKDAATAGYIVNMLIMGVWHGISADYILYGLYHGVLLATMERIQKMKWYKANKSKKHFKLASWFVTLNLVMFGFLIFSGYFTETIKILINMI